MELQQTIQSVNIDTCALQQAFHQLILDKAAAFTPSAWEITQTDKLRQQILDQIVFRGVPEKWIHHQTRVEQAETIQTGNHYEIQKVRLEVLPDLWIPGLLYFPLQSLDPEPNPESRIPAVLSVNGHIGYPGKSTGFVQRRCINLAKRGIITLHLEWFSFGELSAPNYKHNRLAYLDLCGVSGLSVFYLAMRGGLDLLWEHPQVDRKQIGMTGLSGGGWQTIMLSALDPRITLVVPNAGYIDIANRLAHRGDIGDLEQNPTDLIALSDYTHLTALLAPRPALLIYNEQDDCCFVADRAKPAVYDPIKTVYALIDDIDNESTFAYHKNINPGTHNYDRDNREQLYRFLNRHFAPRLIQDQDIPCESEIRSFKELVVGLPEKTANFRTLASDFMENLEEVGSVGEGSLKDILCFQESEVVETQLEGNADGAGGQLIFDNGLIAPICEFRPAIGSEIETILLIADQGMEATIPDLTDLLRAGRSVIAVDLFLTGQAVPAEMSTSQVAMLISTVGLRGLGLQTAQLCAIIDWICQRHDLPQISILSRGRTTGIVAELAAQLCPHRVADLTTQDALSSLRDLIDNEMEYENCPTLFCFGLLQHFDICPR